MTEAPPLLPQVESIQDEIKQLHNNVNQVSDLHSRRLATTDDAQQHESASYLTELTQATSALTNSIRNRITKLNEHNKRSAAGDPDFNTRKLQIGGLQNAFKRGLEEYNLVEKKSREKYRQRMERQIRIGESSRPRSALLYARLTRLYHHSQARCHSGGDQGGVRRLAGRPADLLAGCELELLLSLPLGADLPLTQLVQSRQSGARAAFAEVQSRNQDLRKIEETITQLAQMMQDVRSLSFFLRGRPELTVLPTTKSQMATLVLEQDESVRQIETTAVQANTDVESGYVSLLLATSPPPSPC